MDDIKLTKKQQQVYNLLLQDKNVNDIVKELSLSKGNVLRYINAIKNRMGVEKELAPSKHPNYNHDLLRGIAVLNMLRTGNRVKIAAMSEKLGVNERTIRRDVASLVHAGYRIYSFYGKNGGYEIRNEVITEDEWAIIRSSIQPQLYLRLRKRVDEF